MTAHFRRPRVALWKFEMRHTRILIDWARIAHRLVLLSEFYEYGRATRRRRTNTEKKKPWKRTREGKKPYLPPRPPPPHPPPPLLPIFWYRKLPTSGRKTLSVFVHSFVLTLIFFSLSHTTPIPAHAHPNRFKFEKCISCVSSLRTPSCGTCPGRSRM